MWREDEEKMRPCIETWDLLKEVDKLCSHVPGWASFQTSETKVNLIHTKPKKVKVKHKK